MMIIQCRWASLGRLSTAPTGVDDDTLDAIMRDGVCAPPYYADGDMNHYA